MPYVTAKDGTALHYLDWGSGQPMLFVPSAWLPVQMWEHQLTDLTERGLRCVAYDRRGHGRSDAPWDGYDYDTLADDLAALVDHLDLRDLTLVGHSAGGGEVVRYLTRHGAHRVRGIVLLAATTPFPKRTADNPHGVPAELSAADAAYRAADRPRWNAERAASFFALDTNEVSPEQIEWFRDIIMRCTPRAHRATYATAFHTDLRDELRALRVPTLVLHGDRDEQAPLEVCGRRAAELVPGSELRVYQGAAHGLFVTHAARLNDDLHGFATR
ncbi:pimeloyl-ACP methyl ester carboxylesterase [Actinoplanes octamycinicus]|uniref:Pimeloyl-ACP methyl ester carboxylesterase n=1 Tax=Actinoplanes octamycinicus TaxID=135948 RepID=A0A7W7H306_9ACTN|nr:alpha/beta hydrolase [Actinoplanes octamycinicus]MBB4742732.1 pimeloyl-ACP methyl ester carboxylesterase [Actinoplanes octamycinicus]GIE63032.1 arylesterase [Actinoplanes octamycinicus]